MRRRWCLWTVICLFFLLMFCACGDDDGGVTVTAAELTDQGWTKFEVGDFDGAVADFKAAIGLDAGYAEAYLGLGWAELRRTRAGLAEEAFINNLAKSSTWENHAKGGLALACHAQKKFEDAIQYAQDLLSTYPQWSFNHDANANYLDIALVLAHSYYLTAEYTQSLTVIQQYFDPTYSVDVNTDAGRAALGEKLNGLYTG